MATQKQLNELKAAWREDPCWDLYLTDGFEEHEKELRAYQQAVEKEWADKRQEELRKKAEKLGFPFNISLARYIESLEDQIKRLESRLANVEENYQEKPVERKRWGNY